MLEFFDEVSRLAQVLEKDESDHIHQAAQIVAKSIMSGGITQAFGSGHSYAAAIEVSGRAGGLIPSKIIQDPAGGYYETCEGVGKHLMHRVDLKKNDVLFLISNSGRNPEILEIADEAKKIGTSIIVVTALKSSKMSTSRSSLGTLLYQYGDVVLDNHSKFGDAALNVPGFDSKVCGTSTVSATLLLQQVIFEAIKLMVKKGFNPPVYKSANIDGGPEYNENLENKYADRIFHS
ncbi:SIS domain-containing protein [Companilactobacillus halodurans]|uniref:Sugar isomerase domain-containing protein n=1 Tax=Companilactobacillus halodurans TaxID=2584183 RepID=A0A5P0ZX87_9LACO|nr:sugar isomerase domain-containing protein [Companilactobacillus halodurans]MQS75149.1 sugar isomerase domain-containing protein [Companilactobacillus halodurans]MQS97587.1 sugar isomerase domain-containing protein [Companilactobacillus halodurans]